MSIKSKDLQYDKEASQPAFLQRLRNQNASFTASGRQENPTARPQRLRTAADEDEDAPTYVVEGSSEVLSREQYQKLASGEADDEVKGESKVEGGDVKAGVEPELKDKDVKKSVVDAGASTAKKRKVVKVIGGDSDDETPGDAPKPEPSTATKKKPKKKAKAIKLSFGDEE